MASARYPPSASLCTVDWQPIMGCCWPVSQAVLHFGSGGRPALGENLTCEVTEGVWLLCRSVVFSFSCSSCRLEWSPDHTVDAGEWRSAVLSEPKLVSPLLLLQLFAGRFYVSLPSKSMKAYYDKWTLSYHFSLSTRPGNEFFQTKTYSKTVFTSC